MNVHIGKRGLVLLMFGGVFISYGLALREAQPTVLWLFSSIPTEIQGWAWIITGALAAVCAFTSSREWWGFTALFPMPSLWSVGFLFAFLRDEARINGTLVWALVVGILLVISDWPEPPPKHPEGQ